MVSISKTSAVRNDCTFARPVINKISSSNALEYVKVGTEVYRQSL